MKKIAPVYNVTESHSPLPVYDREPRYKKIQQNRDLMIPMRDDVKLCIDVYRPDDPGKFPVLFTYAPHNKDLQTPEACENSGPQPAWAPLWLGAQEAGDTKFFVSRGYIHVISNPRGVGKSEGTPQASWYGLTRDMYDLIEWISKQSWCNGNVGMIGISAFAGAQWMAAVQQPPALKAIFPYDAMNAYELRDLYPGGVLHPFLYLIDQLNVTHMVRDVPGKLSSEREKLWQEAMDNPDFRMYGHIYNMLAERGQHTSALFDTFLNPFETEESIKKTEEDFAKIKIPAYTGAGWYAYSYKLHMQGCQRWFQNIKSPKKILFTGPAHLERPWHSFHSEILRWYDYWLNGIDTGIMREPPVKMWVMGANAWYLGDDWPLPETKWTKFFLHTWERLREEPFIPFSRDAEEQPDAFVQMPPTQTREIAKLRYLTEPLPEDVMVVGPSVLKLYAAIDQTDTNWIIILKDVGPDVSVRTAKEGENFVPGNLPERELTRGWLKASNRALDPERSKPWRPFYKLTKDTVQPVVPGEITEYDVEIFSTANLFKQGHRICLEITSMDMPTGTAGFTNVEYFPYHICSSKTTLHKIYRSEKYPSYLLLPIIPKEKIEG